MSFRRFYRRDKKTKRIVILGEAISQEPFVWLFHDGKYWINQRELYEFIREGIITDTRGERWNPDDFIAFAEKWARHYETEDMKKNYIDGLRVVKNYDTLSNGFNFD
jgi:hypothetical protein